MYTENKNVPGRDLGGGVTRKLLSYSDNLMAAEIHFEAGSSGAMHSHPHEQISYVVYGKIIYKEEGQADKVLVTGDSYYVKPDVQHGVEVLEESVLLDIFTPMRKDFI